MSASTVALLAGTGAPADSATERILDAALAQFLDFGLRRTTVEDVAARAGVTRVTVHRRVGRKSDLVQAVILRELTRFLHDFTEALEPLATLEEKLVEGFVVTMRSARLHPLITRILATEPETLLPELTVDGGPYLTAACSFLVEQVRAEAQGYVVEDVAAIGEIFIRLVASFVLTPNGAVTIGDDASARTFARRHLAPLLGTARRRSKARAAGK